MRQDAMVSMMSMALLTFMATLGFGMAWQAGYVEQFWKVVWNL